MPQNSLSLAHPKSEDLSPSLSNYTMCPNWLYDTVLVNESASVAKVVLYINRNTTGRSQAGHRAETVQASYPIIAREMNMSIRAVGEAVRIALAKGYIIQVKAGRAATSTRAGEGSWYTLNWQWPHKPLSIYVNLGVEQNHSDAQTVLETLPEQVQNPLNRTERQKLPGRVWQKLPVDINKPESESNKKIELTASEPPGFANKLVSSSISNSETKNLLKPKRRGSRAIGRLMTDFTRELGDTASLNLPNIGRALNLWNGSGLNESDFMAVLYETRKRVLSQTAPIHHKRIDSQGGLSDYPNRMPYFFRVLENLIAHPLSEHGSLPAPVWNVGLKQSLTAIDQCSVQDSRLEVTKLSLEAGRGEIIEPEVLEKGAYSELQLPEKEEVELISFSIATDVLLSEEIKGWAARWSSNAELVIEKWQVLLDHLPTTLRQFFESKALIIPGELATQPLLTAIELGIATDKNEEAVRDLILICRNPFELRYLNRFLPDLTVAISLILQYKVQIWPVSL